MTKTKSLSTKIVRKKKPFKQHVTRLKVGEKAPLFEGTDENGKIYNNQSFLSKPYVLYFYPKDNTSTCIKQACGIRDDFQLFKKHKLQLLGVSADDSISHQKFITKHQLPFSLIADTERKLINAFDVWGKKMLAGRKYNGIVRTTFLINAEGTIEKIITKVNSADHVKQILGLI